MKKWLTRGWGCAIVMVFEDITFHGTFPQKTAQVGDPARLCGSPTEFVDFRGIRKYPLKEDVLRE